MRDGIIYRGADDNASGVAGMLALGKTWAGIEEQPPCNIVFAAWTAEEKGEIGSQYFVEHIFVIPDQVLVSINMDMISRSAPDDTARRQLSVGTLPISEDLRQIAVKANQSLAKPFELDLWDVSGHSGSDYTYFAAVGIPIMTFFSGFHDDYHTSRDIAVKADLQKMNNILNLVNCCIWQILKSVIIN
jgi:Zn-dependent M28 family amino/carboxypeptidase